MLVSMGVLHTHAHTTRQLCNAWARNAKMKKAVWLSESTVKRPDHMYFLQCFSVDPYITLFLLVVHLFLASEKYCYFFFLLWQSHGLSYKKFRGLRYCLGLLRDPHLISVFGFEIIFLLLDGHFWSSQHICWVPFRPNLSLHYFKVPFHLYFPCSKIFPKVNITLY